MLPQEYRLRRKRDIEITFEQGHFVAGRLLNLKAWKVDPAAYPKRLYSGNELKFAFVVGVKIEKRAVGRNRLKRQMREVIRLLLKEEALKSGFFVLVMAKKEMLATEYGDIEQDVHATLRRAGLLLSL